MCTVCGCSEGETTIDPGPKAPGAKGHGSSHSHGHDHHHHASEGAGHHHAHHHHEPGHHAHAADGSLHFGQGPAGVSVGGLSQARIIEIEQDILGKNDTLAARNRTRLEAADILALNLMSSPGSGKTTLLVETLKALGGSTPMAVIEGDQQTSNDAARIRQTGVAAVQVNTGKGCHLDAAMIGSALDHMEPPAGGILFIENVGNLVCPAGFDLGESRRVVLASVTEGEDKPLKYPDMFATADVMLITKTDLLPHLSFDVEALIANARQIRPGLEIIHTSTASETGLDDWLAWLAQARERPAAAAE